MSIDSDEVRQYAAVGLTTPVLSCIVASKTIFMTDRNERTCAACAGFLYASGFLDGDLLVCGATNPRTQRRLLKQLRSEAVDECRRAGILPAGLWWLMIRHVVLPFLMHLFESWIKKNDVSLARTAPRG